MAIPANTTPELWKFWTEFSKNEPDALFGGTYAAKSGYHNTRYNHVHGIHGGQSDDYSIQRPADRKGPSDKAAGLDITFDSARHGNYATIAKYSKRLMRAGTGRDKRFYDTDGQTAIVREFFGNTGGDSEVDGWSWYREREVSSDSSHLWHIHLSFSRAYLESWSKLSPILDVLLARSGDELPDAKEVVHAVLFSDVIENPGNKENPRMTLAGAVSDLEKTQDNHGRELADIKKQIALIADKLGA